MKKRGNDLLVLSSEKKDGNARTSKKLRGGSLDPSQGRGSKVKKGRKCFKRHLGGGGEKGEFLKNPKVKQR